VLVFVVLLVWLVFWWLCVVLLFGVWSVVAGLVLFGWVLGECGCAVASKLILALKAAYKEKL
jgi:hypothetical protein